MIETRARVVRDVHGQLRMHGETPAACGACQVRGSCAGNDDALDIAPDDGLCDGQSVILSVREADLLRASFYAYGVPSLSVVVVEVEVGLGLRLDGVGVVSAFASQGHALNSLDLLQARVEHRRLA